MNLGATLAAALASAPIAVFETIDSTKEEARRRAAVSTSAGWLLGLTQTEGRGRRGREWQAPPGNLSLTGYAFHESPVIELPQLSFVAALAAYDCAADFLPLEPLLSLKWPNDVLLNGRKLAGLLLESGRGAEGHSWVSLSVGMNLAAAPPGEAIGQPAICLGDFTQPPSPHAAAESFRAGLIRALETLQRDGFATIRRSWLERAASLGQSVRVQLTNEILHGLFEGLSDDGALLLKLPNGEVRVISAGDVFFDA